MELLGHVWGCNLQLTTLTQLFLVNGSLLQCRASGAHHRNADIDGLWYRSATNDYGTCSATTDSSARSLDLRCFPSCSDSVYELRGAC